MKNKLSWFPVVLFFLAVILMFAADRLGLPALRFAAVIVIGLTAVLSGIQFIITREAFFLPSGRDSLRRRAESYSGLAAQIWGLIFVLFGLIFIGIGVIGSANPEGGFSFVERALETATGWGVLLMVIGVFVTLYGATRVLAGGAHTSGASAWLQLRDMGYRLFGFVVVVVGLLLLAVGYLLFASPETLTGWIEQWRPTLDAGLWSYSQYSA
jgi:hypothetical protein